MLSLLYTLHVYINLDIDISLHVYNIYILDRYLMKCSTNILKVFFDRRGPILLWPSRGICIKLQVEFWGKSTGGFQISLVKFGQICETQQTYYNIIYPSKYHWSFYCLIFPFKRVIFLCKKCVAVGYVVHFLTYPPRRKKTHALMNPIRSLETDSLYETGNTRIRF